MANEGFKRKLAAILSANVEAYSCRMGDDEGATIKILTAYSHENITDFMLYRLLKATIAQKKNDSIICYMPGADLWPFKSIT